MPEILSAFWKYALLTSEIYCCLENSKSGRLRFYFNHWCPEVCSWYTQVLIFFIFNTQCLLNLKIHEWFLDAMSSRFTHKNFYIFLNAQLRTCSLILQRGGGRERERRETSVWESNVDQLLLMCSLMGDRTHALGMCSDGEWIPRLLVCRMTLHQLSHTGQGNFVHCLNPHVWRHWSVFHWFLIFFIVFRFLFFIIPS